MDNKFKLRISRIFHSSCKSRDDVLEKSPLLSRSPSVPHELPRPPPPLPRPSMCNTRTPSSLQINDTCIVSSSEVRDLVRPTKSKSNSKVAALSHFANNPFYDHGGSRYSAVKKHKKISDCSGNDEREDDMFSLRSLSSSESSENRHRTRNNDATGLMGSVAVVKKSSDPSGDFMRSMIEMIIERQIFGAHELEQLLLCFLSLNSIHHHNIIVQVFNEILDALFSM